MHLYIAVVVNKLVLLYLSASGTVKSQTGIQIHEVDHIVGCFQNDRWSEIVCVKRVWFNRVFLVYVTEG